MKKVSSLIFVCVLVFGIVTIFSGVASAGDPYEGNSWHQKFREFMVGGFDTMEISIESQSYFSNSSSSTILGSSNKDKDKKDKDKKDKGKSVPDVGIMWLLGPALIALGLLGRKKSQRK